MDNQVYNPLNDVFTVAYLAGQIERPFNTMLVMPSESGKSLTAYRYEGLDDVLFIGGDTTAQSLREKINLLYDENRLERIRLVIIEDWSKIRTKVTTELASVIAQIASGRVSINQYKMTIRPTPVHASVMILVPNPAYDRLTKALQRVGTGNRFAIYSTWLTSKAMMNLNRISSINRGNHLLQAIPRIPIKNPNMNEDYANFYDQNHEKLYSNTNMINMAYAYKQAGWGDRFEEYELSRKYGLDDLSWDNYWINQIEPKQGNGEVV